MPSGGPLRLGARDFLAKPFGLDLLLQKVEAGRIPAPDHPEPARFLDFLGPAASTAALAEGRASAAGAA